MRYFTALIGLAFALCSLGCSDGGAGGNNGAQPDTSADTTEQRDVQPDVAPSFSNFASIEACSLECRPTLHIYAETESSSEPGQGCVRITIEDGGSSGDANLQTPDGWAFNSAIATSGSCADLFLDSTSATEATNASGDIQLSETSGGSQRQVTADVTLEFDDTSNQPYTTPVDVQTNQLDVQTRCPRSQCTN